MNYKELFKIMDTFTAKDFHDVREAIQKIIDKNPKATYHEAQNQIESFKKIKKDDNSN